MKNKLFVFLLFLIAIIFTFIFIYIGYRIAFEINGYGYVGPEEKVVYCKNPNTPAMVVYSDYEDDEAEFHDGIDEVVYLLTINEENAISKILSEVRPEPGHWERHLNYRTCEIPISPIFRIINLKIPLIRGDEYCVGFNKNGVSHLNLRSLPEEKILELNKIYALIVEKIKGQPLKCSPKKYFLDVVFDDVCDIEFKNEISENNLHNTYFEVDYDILDRVKHIRKIQINFEKSLVWEKTYTYEKDDLKPSMITYRSGTIVKRVIFSQFL